MARPVIVLYEFITSGGWRSVYRNEPCPRSLAAEGQAMLLALAADFSKLADFETRVMCDRPAVAEAARIAAGLKGCTVVEVEPSNERAVLERQTAQAAWTLVVAPEFDGVLVERARWVEAAGGKLLGPSPAVIELTGDKHATALHLGAAGVLAPEGVLIPAGASIPEPLPWPLAIFKPRCGAGSQDTHLVSLDMRAWQQPRPKACEMRLERYCRGQPASVAALCGPAGIFPLIPCWQDLGPTFSFRGGSLPIEAPLAARASRLALAALQALPPLTGYVGVDLVLGETSQDDVVIEINPRLTTSYVGLRALATTNLAQGMLDAANGRAPVLAFHSGQIYFSCDGQVGPG